MCRSSRRIFWRLLFLFNKSFAFVPSTEAGILSFFAPEKRGSKDKNDL
jgi:hypothetical protein